MAEFSGGDNAAGIAVTLSSVSTQSRYRWSEVRANTEERNAPSRCKHAACLWDGYLYVYGGREGNVPHKDLWRFHINSGRWEQMLCKGDRPMLLQEHTIVAYKGKLYVFGGDFSYNSSETPLWIFDIVCRRWTKPVYGEVVTPCGVRGHTAVVCNSNMHVYGGYQDLKGSTGRMWSFDLEEEMWHLTHGDSCSEGDGPGARHAHSAVVHDQAMWVFGGMCDLQPKNDFWKWSFGIRQWTRIRYKQGPPELQGHSAVKVADGMVIYGGDSNGMLQGDIWKFNFGSQTWSRVHFHPPCPLARVHHCAVVVPGFALNSSSNDRSLSVPHVQGTRTKQEPNRPNTSPHSTQLAESRGWSPTERSRSPNSGMENARNCPPSDQLNIPHSDLSGSGSDSDTGSRSSDSAPRRAGGAGHKFRNRILPLYGDVDTLPSPHQFPDQPLVPAQLAECSGEQSPPHTNSMPRYNPTSIREDCVQHLERQLSVVSDISGGMDDTQPLVPGSSSNRSHDMKRSLARGNHYHGQGGIENFGNVARPGFRVTSRGFENPVFRYSISNDSGCNIPWCSEDCVIEPVPVKRQRSDDQCDSSTDREDSSTYRTVLQSEASGRSRAQSASLESLLSTAQSTGGRALLQREVLPGAVKSGSLESLMQGMGGVQLKYINIDEDEDHSAHASDPKIEPVTKKYQQILVENVEEIDNQSIIQSNHAFENPFLSIGQSDVSNFGEEIDMSVLGKTKESSYSGGSTSTAQQYVVGPSLEPREVPTDRGTLLTYPAGMLRESSFVNNSTFSDNNPHRLSRTLDVPDRIEHLSNSGHEFCPSGQSHESSGRYKRDFSTFVTQPDRERISSRGRDMTLYMFVIGGKEESRTAQSLISSQPINMWKLQIY